MLEKLKRLRRREPDFVITRMSGKPYLRRWWITPKKDDVARAYLHNFKDDDEDRALHDHPADSISIILKGGYIEHMPGGNAKRRYPGMIVYRKAEQAHRIELRRNRSGQIIEAWTIFIFFPNRREWGFHCPKGWRHWSIFTSAEDKGQIGRGCD